MYKEEKRNWEEFNLPAEENMPATKKTAREEESKERKTIESNGKAKAT